MGSRKDMAGVSNAMLMVCYCINERDLHNPMGYTHNREARGYRDQLTGCWTGNRDSIAQHCLPSLITVNVISISRYERRRREGFPVKGRATRLGKESADTVSMKPFRAG